MTKVKASPVERRISAGLATPVFGGNSDAGKVAEKLSSLGVGLIGTTENQGYSSPSVASDYTSIVDLGSPWAWKHNPRIPTFGLLTETAASQRPAWNTGLNFAKRVFAPSQWSKDCLDLGDKCVLMPYGVDPVFSLAPVAHTGPFRVMFSAYDVAEERKGLRLAMEAFAKAFQGQDDVEFLIHSTVSRDVQKDDRRIRFRFGGMPAGAMAALYRSADVFVYSSLAEAFPFAALEAMACGVPVIHSGQTGMAELKGLGIEAMSRVVPGPDGQWHEPFVDEIAMLLQFAHSERQVVKAKSAQDAGAVLKKFPWSFEPLLRFL
jgi:glycosyltransferase involved in cell wall biosynthesis